MENTKSLKPDRVEKILKVVCIVSVATLVFSLVFQLLVYFSLGWSVIALRYNTFSDFAEVMYYCFDPIRYSRGVIYPPISFLIFVPLAIFIKKPIDAFLATPMTTNDLFAFAKSAPVIVMLFIYFAINTALIMFIAAKMTKFKGKKLAYLLISIACFGPYIYALFRGNIIMTCLPLVLAFFWLYKSEKRWQREVANLCLAMAIAIKIYPIFLLVFFVKDRRFLDMLKTFVYAIALLFLPFLFISGGFKNVPIMWNNCFGFKGKKAVEIHTGNVSIASLMNQFAYGIELCTGKSLYGAFGWITRILKYTLLIGSIVVFAFAKKSKLRMQVSLLAILDYIIYQDGSYAYVMIYILIPIIFYLLDFDSLSKLDKWFYGICFGIIALPFCYTFNFFSYDAVILIALAVKCFVDLIQDIVRIRKEDKLAKTQAADETQENMKLKQEKNSAKAQVAEKKSETALTEVTESSK